MSDVADFERVMTIVRDAETRAYRLGYSAGLAEAMAVLMENGDIYQARDMLRTLKKRGQRVAEAAAELDGKIAEQEEEES